MVLLQGLQDSPERVHSRVCILGLEAGFRHTTGLWAPDRAGAAGEPSRKRPPNGAQFTSPQLPGAPSLLELATDLMERRVLGPQSS